MSDLTATNCGCNSCNNNSSFFGGNNSCWILILILLFSCGNNCNGCGFGNVFGNRSGCDCDNGNNSCEWLIWILLISCFCGNNNGCC